MKKLSIVGVSIVVLFATVLFIVTNSDARVSNEVINISVTESISNSRTTVESNNCTQEFLEKYVKIQPYLEDEIHLGFFLIIDGGYGEVLSREGKPQVMASSLRSKCLLDCIDEGADFKEYEVIYSCELSEDCELDEDEIVISFFPVVEGEDDCRADEDINKDDWVESTKSDWDEDKDTNLSDLCERGYPTERWEADICGFGTTDDSTIETNPLDADSDGDRVPNYNGKLDTGDSFDEDAAEDASTGRGPDCSLASFAPANFSFLSMCVAGLGLLGILRKRKK